jgi:hypothetical protein
VTIPLNDQYKSDNKPCIDLVNLRCTASTLFMFPKVCGDQNGEQYSNKKHTYVKNAVFKMVLSFVAKLLRMSLAFISAIQTMDEICRLNVRFESIIIPRSRVYFDQLNKLATVAGSLYGVGGFTVYDALNMAITVSNYVHKAFFSSYV